MNPIIIQTIGIIGLVFVAISFQKNKKSFTLISQFISALFFTVHFFLLNAPTAGVMNIISAGRAYTFNLRDSKPWINNKFTLITFILLFWIAGILTWQGFYSLLPVVSMTLECFALWSKNTKLVRRLFLSARPGWLIYDLIVGSYAGLATEAFIITSLVIAIIRFDILTKKNKLSLH